MSLDVDELWGIGNKTENAINSFCDALIFNP